MILNITIIIIIIIISIFKCLVIFISIATSVQSKASEL